ncbi:MAG TPA: S9 family peptidase [Bacteroidales bacterium]|nr:S9 family peptidase [Bacteroidales bacterium]
MKKIVYFMAAMAVMMASCNGEDADKGALIEKKPVKIENGLMTPEVLWSMGRVTGISVSPDNQQVLYNVQYFDIAQNKGNKDLYVVPVAGGDPVRLTNTKRSENEAVWSADGKLIYFLYNGQLWKMKSDGSKRKQLTNYESDLEGFIFSPDESKIMFVSQVKYGKRVKDIYPDLDKSSGRVIDDLMYKHWDEWVETIPHPFIADLTKKGLENVTDILKDEPFESPMKPWGGIEQIAWAPDGKSIAYTCRKKTGKEYALSTNSDIYLYNLETKVSTNLTSGMMGYDTDPVFSPDGQSIAFLSMEHDGYESDKNRLFIHTIQTGTNRCISDSLDGDVSEPCWTKDSQNLFFLSAVEAVTQIFTVDVKSQSIKQVTNESSDVEKLALAGDQLIALKHSISRPNEIFRIQPKDGEMVALTNENKEIFDQLKVGRVEKRMIKTTDNQEMLTWVVYPPDFDSTKTYPAILFCSGGPQGTVGQFWSYRWNFQLMAAKGYIVVAPNRRGVSGMGQKWKEEISKDWGGQNMRDYLSAIDAVSAEPYVDKNRLGCVGASYGGFSVYWLAGNHHKRFKAFIAHSGIFNCESQYLETEEMWFENWETGGPFWDSKNVIAQKSFANSPHKFVQNWDTPILCIHGEKDYRILASQGMQAFNAAKLRGIPAELLVFPDENHWIIQPQNSILWQRTFFAWLDRWLK